MHDLILLQPDKLLHFAFSFLIARVEPILALAAGIGKELWDSVSDGDAEWSDLAADLLGILTAMLFGA